MTALRKNLHLALNIFSVVSASEQFMPCRLFGTLVALNISARVEAYRLSVKLFLLLPPPRLILRDDLAIVIMQKEEVTNCRAFTIDAFSVEPMCISTCDVGYDVLVGCDYYKFRNN